MNEVFWLIAGAVCSFLAMVWLSMAMQSNCKLVFGRDAKPNSMFLRSLSVLALIVSGMCCLQADHASMAILVWFMYLTSAAFIVSMLLSYKQSIIRLFTPRTFIY